MTLTAIGPLTVRVRKPAYNWTSSPLGHGIRQCAISGVMQWAQAQSMSEMVANQSARQTTGGQTGVQQYLNFDDVLLGPFSGYYLLQNFALLGDWQWAGHGIDYPVGFTLSAAYLGDMAP